MKVFFIEATAPGGIGVQNMGIAFDNEVEFKEEDGWTSMSISGKPQTHCPFTTDDEGITEGPDCGFQYHDFRWGYDSVYSIACRCDNYHDNFEYLKTSELCYCKRAAELDCEDGVSSELLYTNVVPVKERKHQSAYIHTKIANSEILPIILETKTFIHLLTYNIDKYFLGILQTLAINNVEVLILLSKNTLKSQTARDLLTAQSFVNSELFEPKLNIRVSNVNHAKRAFIDGVYDLDLESVNLSFQALHYNNENDASIEYAHPLKADSRWEIIRKTHDAKFLDFWDEGIELAEYCEKRWSTMYAKTIEREEHRRKVDEIIRDRRRNHKT